MRIQSIQVYQKDLPINDGPYTMSTMELHSIDTTIIKMASDNGQIGWGEVAPLGPLYQPEHAVGVRAAIDQLAPALTGADPLNTRAFQQVMASRLNGCLYAKAALEMAQLDLKAKHHGIRVCDLLGGALNEKLPAYYAISINSPDETVRQAREKVNAGYRRLQLKAGGRDLAIDIEMIKKVWEAVGTRARLVVDANRGLTAAIPNNSAWPATPYRWC
jgi:L-alanine-DL-glutamate epimerase-like enolase superfamily enzyme